MRLIACVIPSSHSTVTSGTQSSPEHEHVEERDAEVVHRHAEQHEHDAGEHDARDLGGRRELDDVVDEADGEADRAREHDTRRFGVVGEQRLEAIHRPGHADRREEPAEHRDATDVRCDTGVDPSLVRFDDPSEPAGEHPDEWRQCERHERGHGTDEQVAEACGSWPG